MHITILLHFIICYRTNYCNIPWLKFFLGQILASNYQIQYGFELNTQSQQSFHFVPLVEVSPLVAVGTLAVDSHPIFHILERKHKEQVGLRDQSEKAQLK